MERAALFILIDRLVFDTLAARRAIKVDTIGQLSVVMAVSTKSRSASHVPHYELILSETREDDVVLLDEVKGLKGLTVQQAQELYEAWLERCNKESAGLHRINIPGVVTIVKTNKEVIITPSKELLLQLSPFGVEKKKNSKEVIWLGRIAILLVGVVIYFGLDMLKNHKPIENKPLVGQAPPKVVIEPVVVAVDTITETPPLVDSVKKEIAPKIDSVEVKPKIKQDRFYIIVGSYTTEKEAINEAIKKQKIYKNLKVETTEKTGGNGFVNYVFVSDSETRSTNVRDSLQPRYPKLKGMWIYRKRE